MEKKKSFILYTDNRNQINMLSDQQAGRLFKALFAFAESGDIPTFDDGMTAMAFSFISSQISRDSEKYDEVCKKRSESGKKGGIASYKSQKAKKANQANQANADFAEKNQANADFAEKNQANQADNDTVTENDNETDTVTDIVSDIITDTVAHAKKKLSGKRTAEEEQQQDKKKEIISFGDYGNVKLTQEQYDKLCQEFGKKTITDYIQRMDDWVQLKGNTYNDYGLALRQWLDRDKIIPGTKRSSWDDIDFSKFVNNFG